RTFKHSGKNKKRQLVLLTVTLPSSQVHSDQHIKRHCLVPYMDILKYHYKIQHYFWRAEAQQNGNIHFHIILDRYIPFMDAQDLWNQVIERIGYVTRFARKHNHFKPPTTNIKVI
ncbi:hypothetical protein RZS08_38695, partial [Arthrospira platensis SPKY1]|nr:hypothetical protein [Arthrospira platensis SPKY1]